MKTKPIPFEVEFPEEADALIAICEHNAKFEKENPNKIRVNCDAGTVTQFNKSLIEEEIISRNTPCPCGSTKKYKKCCIN